MPIRTTAARKEEIIIAGADNAHMAIRVRAQPANARTMPASTACGYDSATAPP